MDNILKILLGASALLFSTFSSATIISITYDVDFTSHSNNAADKDWINGAPTTFDTIGEVQNYLDGSNYYLTVEYNTKLDGYRIDQRDGTKSLRSDGTKSDGTPYEQFQGKIIDSNIDLTSSDYWYQFYNVYMDNTYTSTQVDNFLTFDFLGGLEDLKVGDKSDFGDMYNMGGMHQYNHTNGFITEAFARDIYLADLTIRNIKSAVVPEPSIIALIAAGLFGIGFARRGQS